MASLHRSKGCARRKGAVGRPARGGRRRAVAVCPCGAGGCGGGVGGACLAVALLDDLDLDHGCSGVVVGELV